MSVGTKGERLGLLYLGHLEGASLGYFTGATVTCTAGDVFPLPEAGLVLGRGPRATLRIASSEVARAHCRVRPMGEDTAEVEDLGSTNGTSLNGEPIDETTTMRAGDRLRLAGGFDLELVRLSPAGPGEPRRMTHPDGAAGS